jgi:YD repeat-containing protein
MPLKEMPMRTRLTLAPAILLSAMIAASCSHWTPVADDAPTLTPAPSTPAAPAPAVANAAGTWTWTYDGGGQSITHTYTLAQSGETLTGTFKDSFDDTSAPISDDKVVGRQVSFTVVRPLMDNNMTFHFAGTLDGDTLTGKANWTMMDQPTTADWVAKRTR